MASCKGIKEVISLPRIPKVEVIGVRNAPKQVPVKNFNNFKLGFKYGFNGALDTIELQKEGVVLHSFKAKGRKIVDSVFEPIDLKRKYLFKDVLNRTRQQSCKTKKYYNYFHGYPAIEWAFYDSGQAKSKRIVQCGKTNLVEWWPNGILRKREKNDSLFEYSSKGIIKRAVFGFSEKQYNDAGILVKQIFPRGYQLFWSNGVLKLEEKDTWVNNNLVTQFIDYYPTGIIKQERFYFNSTPCLTWSSYSLSGKLLKKEFKSNLKEPELAEVLPKIYEDNTIYADVDDYSEFPGGMDKWEEFINDQWKPKVKINAEELVTYLVRFWIDQNGQVKVTSKNTSLVGKELERIIALSPRWKPRMESGKYVSIELEYAFKIRKKD